MVHGAQHEEGPFEGTASSLTTLPQPHPCCLLGKSNLSITVLLLCYVHLFPGESPETQKHSVSG